MNLEDAIVVEYIWYWRIACFSNHLRLYGGNPDVDLFPKSAVLKQCTKRLHIGIHHCAYWERCLVAWFMAQTVYVVEHVI